MIKHMKGILSILAIALISFCITEWIFLAGTHTDTILQQIVQILMYIIYSVGIGTGLIMLTILISSAEKTKEDNNEECFDIQNIPPEKTKEDNNEECFDIQNIPPAIIMGIPLVIIFIVVFVMLYHIINA